MTKISATNLPRVASIKRPPRELPEIKKIVNLATISQNNLPRVAQLQTSVSRSALGPKPKHERDRWTEAARTFEPGLDRELGPGRESPGPQQYATHANIVGNPNYMDARIRAPKRFSMAKAKRDMSCALGEGADVGIYNITNGGIATEKSRRSAGAVWGKAERRLNQSTHTFSDYK